MRIGSLFSGAGWLDLAAEEVSRNDALKIAGNGVVTPQAAAALRQMIQAVSV